MTKLLLIGCGYWGKNWYKTILNSKYQLSGVVDPTPIIKITDHVPVFNRIKDVNVTYTHAIIAVPAQYHLDTVRKLDIDNKNILVEKPCGTCVEDANQMEGIYPGYIFLSSPEYKFIKKNIHLLGKIFSIRSRRASMGPRVRTDVDIVGDYLIHDLYMVKDLLGDEININYKMLSNTFKKPILRDTITLDLQCGDIHINMYSSWRHPLKAREFTIIGENGAFTLDGDDLIVSHQQYNSIEGVDKYGNIGYELTDEYNENPIGKKLSNLETELIDFVEGSRPNVRIIDMWKLIEKIVEK